MKTKQSLGIFWNFESGQEEVDGLIFYGLWSDELPKKLETQSLQNLFIGGIIEINEARFDADDYKTYSISFYIKSFPKAEFWLNNIKVCLSWLIDNGAIVSWCGSESCSPNPEILRPRNSAGNIYAGYSIPTGFICNANLEDELEYLNDQQLQKLNEASIKN